MSVCPKCSKKLRLLDLGQQCPHCGVNMRFYKFDEKFYREAKEAELSLARVHVKFSVLKASLIGGKLPIARLSCSLLPLLTLLIPSAVARLTLPFLSEDVTLSALGLYNTYGGGMLNLIISMKNSPVDGEAFSMLLLSMCALAVTAVFAVFTLLMSILCFASIKKMSVALCCVSGAGVLSSIATGVAAFMLCSRAEESSGLMLEGSMSAGFAVSAVMFIVVFVLNLLIAKNGLDVEFKEGDLERLEILKKVKRGEIKIDDPTQAT